MWATIAAIIGAVISIATLIYMTGFWKRGVDDGIENLRSDVKEIKEELKLRNLASFCTMVQTLWDVYVLDPLHKRPDIASQHSPLSLTQKAIDSIPDDVKETLLKIPAPAENKGLGYLAVTVIGINRIAEIAKVNGESLQVTIATLTQFLEENLDRIDKSKGIP
jgi:hypothetical protein